MMAEGESWVSHCPHSSLEPGGTWPPWASRRQPAGPGRRSATCGRRMRGAAVSICLCSSQHTDPPPLCLARLTRALAMLPLRSLRSLFRTCWCFSRRLHTRGNHGDRLPKLGHDKVLCLRDPVRSKPPHGEEAEGEIQHREAHIHAEGDPAVLPRQL